MYMLLMKIFAILSRLPAGPQYLALIAAGQLTLSGGDFSIYDHILDALRVPFRPKAF